MKWGIVICLWVVIFMGLPIATLAGSLDDRLGLYPQWHTKPTVATAAGDLVYPEWMEGTWTVTNILVDQVAPLSPKVVTPGFEGNRRYLQQPITFEVKFARKFVSTFGAITGRFLIIADRAFNGLKIAQAYLNKDRVLSVKVDPQNPNRQITVLQGNYQLISTVTGRASETPNSHKFLATEMTNQIFRSQNNIYVNEVETTSYYQLMNSTTIIAEQVTAIYLSPQDPNYFKARNQPVALYKYRLELEKNNN